MADLDAAQSLSWAVYGHGVPGESNLDTLARAGRRALHSNDPILRISDCRPRQLLIVTATIWTSSGAGDRIILIESVTTS